MSTYTQQFGEHKIHQNINEACKHLERSEIQQLNKDQISNFTRLKKGIAAVRSKIEALDPELLSIDTINTLANNITQIRAESVAFLSNKNFGHINNANNYLDQLLNSARIQLVLAPETDQAVSKAVTDAHEKSLELFKKGSEAISGLKTKVDEYHQSTEHGKAHIQELEKVIETQKSRLDQAISNFQQQFSTQQSQRSTEFTTTTNNVLQEFAASQKEFSGKFIQALSDQSNEFKKHLDEVKQRSSTHQEFLDKRKGEVDEMFGAIGQGLRAGHFANTADAERKSANLFRWISLGLMTAMIIAAGFTYYYSLTHTEVDWKLLLLRFGTTMIIAIPAVYAAQESSRHRDREKKLRKLHLELASIDAYLSLLPTETQYKLKEELTAKFFGQTELESKDTDVSKHALFELIKGAVENLTKSK